MNNLTISLKIAREQSIDAAVLFAFLKHVSSLQQPFDRNEAPASRNQIERNTGLTRYRQETARKKLVDAGLIEEELGMIPARMIYIITEKGEQS